MDKYVRLALKENHVYKAIFDHVAPGTKESDDNAYDEIRIYTGGGVKGHNTDEIIYYDGGGVRGYGN